MRSYIFDNEGNPVEEPNLTKWGEWFSDNDSKRIVKQDTIGDVLVSTVFLGLDHNFEGGIPLLYETMIFQKGKSRDYQDRYSTKEEALEGHERAIKHVKGQLQ